MLGMLGMFGSELAKIRAESLRGEGSPRSVKTPGRVRKALVHRFLVAGERLLGDRRDANVVRMGGGT
jgi:hypothetical protein